MIDVEKKLIFKGVKVRPRVILRYVIAYLETALIGFWSVILKVPLHIIKKSSKFACFLFRFQNKISASTAVSFFACSSQNSTLFEKTFNFRTTRIFSRTVFP
jgi:hypothetical protein